MAGSPRFSVFRPRIEPLPSKGPDGNKLRLLSLSDGDAGEARKANLKLAWFFDVVALLLVPADHLGRVEYRTDANLGPHSTALGSLTVSPKRRRERTTFLAACPNRPTQMLSSRAATRAQGD
jgi:hypothetical protein